MTDIVDRLRAVETDDIPQKYLMADMLEAAAEIERLRAEVKALKAPPSSKREQMHMVMDGAIAAMKAIKDSKL